MFGQYKKHVKQVSFSLSTQNYHTDTGCINKPETYIVLCNTNNPSCCEKENFLYVTECTKLFYKQTALNKHSGYIYSIIEH